MLNFLGALLGGVSSFFTGKKKETGPKKTNVVDLTGLTWEQARDQAIKRRELIVHAQWPKGEFAWWDETRECFVREDGRGGILMPWTPSYGEEHGGCAWAVIK
jgi:hypothetical protein